MELCPSCHAGCCRKLLVYVLGRDIINIMQSLKIDFNVFIDALPVPQDKKEKYKANKVPMFMFKEGEPGQYYCLALKSDLSKLYPDTTKCIFLLELDAEFLSRGQIKEKISRCGIYSCRPLLCRSFPAAYMPDDEKIIIKDPHTILEKEMVTKDTPAYKLCPRVLNENDYIPFMEGYVKDAVLDHYEHEFFYQVSEKWNKQPDLSDNLPKFLLKEYANRIEHIKESKEKK